MDVDLQKIIGFALKKPDIVDQAYFDFFGPLPTSELKDDWENLFLEWLIFDYQQEKNNITFLAEYTLKNPDQLAEEKIDQFKQIIKTQFYSFFEIQETKENRWLILEDLHTGKTYKVYDELAASSIKSPVNLPGRLATINKRWSLVSAPGVYFPNTYTEKTKKALLEMKIKRYSPKDIVMLLRNTEQDDIPIPPKLTKNEIKAKKDQLQKDYEECLEEYDISLPFDELAQAIYEADIIDYIGFWQNLLETSLTENFFYTEHKLLQEIWNYFPHRRLSDMSPVEFYNKAKGRLE